jgi:hypothetical protein
VVRECEKRGQVEVGRKRGCPWGGLEGEMGAISHRAKWDFSVLFTPSPVPPYLLIPKKMGWTGRCLRRPPTRRGEEGVAIMDARRRVAG